MANLPPKNRNRVVIIGAGFAGLKLARSLKSKELEVVLLDKNNYHQFQPLFYQVATSGLEPSSISFPIRKVLHDKPNVHFRVAELMSIDSDKKLVQTNIGAVEYDYLVLASGATTNFFGNKQLASHAIPMKSVSEALFLRNRILENYEHALNTSDSNLQEAYMNVVIAGGGPTGVELAGAIAEMREFVLPKDYPLLDFNKMRIVLLEGSGRLLNGMSESAGNNALKYLNGLGVQVGLNRFVENYDGQTIQVKDDDSIESATLIWAAGIHSKPVSGIPESEMVRGGRLKVNRFNELDFDPSIMVIGDQAYMETENYPKGHPQVAQVAIQQASLLAKNLERKQNNNQQQAFEYNDKGSMATVGRNLAVCDLPVGKLKGYPAWLLWLFVHLMAILGTKNKLMVFINWAWSYVTYDQSLRLLIKPKTDLKN